MDLFIYFLFVLIYKPGETIQCAALFSHGTHNFHGLIELMHFFKEGHMSKIEMQYFYQMLRGDNCMLLAHRP